MKRLILGTCLAFCLAAVLPAQTTYTISTVAGSVNNTLGDGGGAGGATYVQPVGIAIDLNGNIYISDNGGTFGGNTAPSRIRKIDATTGLISTLTAAATAPSAVSADPTGKFLYVAGDNSHSIWKVDTTTGETTRYAGTGSADMGGNGRPANTVRIRRPQCVWAAPNGDVYFCDTLNNRIQRVDAATGFMYLVAGRGQSNTTVTTSGTAALLPLGDGDLAVKATLANPAGVIGDAAGNIYISDTNSNRIRKVDAITKIITTVVGLGTSSVITSNGPNCTANNPVPCSVNNTAVVDSGDALSITLSRPSALAWDLNGNLLIADSANLTIRLWNLTTNQVRVILGGGNKSADDIAAQTSQLTNPTGVAVDAGGNILVVDQLNFRIRKVDAASGIVSTFSGASQGRGDGATASFATFSNPRGVAVANDGTIYISDTGNNKIRKVSPAGLVSTWAGTGTGGFTFPENNVAATSTRLNAPGCVSVDQSGNLFIADRVNSRIRRVDSGGNMVTVAGSTNLTVNSSGATTGGAVIAGYYGDGLPAVVARPSLITRFGILGAGDIRFNPYAGQATTGTNSITGTANNNAGPSCVAVDSLGEFFIADTQNHVIRKVDPSGIITTVAGYVTSTTNAATGITTTSGISGAGGDGGPAVNAQLNTPVGVDVNPSGTLLCVADTANHAVRLVNLVTLPQSDPTRHCTNLDGTVGCTGLAAFPLGLASGAINTVAGIIPDGGSDSNLPTNGWQSRLNNPQGCAVDDQGNVFIADGLNHRIVTVNPAGQMSLIAGGGTTLASDGQPATKALLTLPAAINLDSSGNIYFTDRIGLIKKLTADK